MRANKKTWADCSEKSEPIGPEKLHLVRAAGIGAAALLALLVLLGLLARVGRGVLLGSKRNRSKSNAQSEGGNQKFLHFGVLLIESDDMSSLGIIAKP